MSGPKRVWYDLEFIEDGHSIDILSIGMVSQDGRELYLQNQECKFRRADAWVKANVFPHLRYFNCKSMKPLLGQYDAPGARSVWATRSGIAERVLRFCDPERYGPLQLWGYYSAYDHVALCQLWGKMIDLPKGFPMYTCDIKQLCDTMGNPPLPEQGNEEHDALADARWNRLAHESLEENIMRGWRVTV